MSRLLLVGATGLVGQSVLEQALAIAVTRGLEPLLPRRWRVVPASQIAGHLLAAAVAAEPGIHVLESERLLDPVPTLR